MRKFERPPANPDDTPDGFMIVGMILGILGFLMKVRPRGVGMARALLGTPVPTPLHRGILQEDGPRTACDAAGATAMAWCGVEASWARERRRGVLPWSHLTVSLTFPCCASLTFPCCAGASTPLISPAPPQYKVLSWMSLLVCISAYARCNSDNMDLKQLVSSVT